MVNATSYCDFLAGELAVELSALFAGASGVKRAVTNKVAPKRLI
jgi:hypothetical protein